VSAMAVEETNGCENKKGCMATRSDTMYSMKRDSRGFTLIASLMLMLIMSGVAIGLLMMVNTEGKVGG